MPSHFKSLQRRKNFCETGLILQLHAPYVTTKTKTPFTLNAYMCTDSCYDEVVAYR